MEEEVAKSREETVEIVAAMGPIMITPAQKGDRLLTMAMGIILSTLP